MSGGYSFYQPYFRLLIILKKVAGIADGRIHIAEQALEKALIPQFQPYDGHFLHMLVRAVHLKQHVLRHFPIDSGIFQMKTHLGW